MRTADEHVLARESYARATGRKSFIAKVRERPELKLACSFGYGYHSWPHDRQSHSKGCTQQPIAAIQGSSTGRIGIPYIVDSERWAEQDGQRGCRANRKSRKLVDPLRCILSWQ